MQTELEIQIRERAYHLWIADGCRDGEADKYWLAAERDLLAAFASSTPAPKARMGRRPANVVSVAKAPAKARRRAS
jgi:hypothetical protein